MAHTQEQSRLLQLPAELQLAIFEFAIIEDEPLLLNCGCDSSYSDTEPWHEDQALWESGEKHPPVQPGLTRTCTAIRSITLPMFYQRNKFRAHYCYATDYGMAEKWLKQIGLANRLLLRDLCLWDMNRWYDLQRPKDLKRVRRGDIIHVMGGDLETLEGKGYCCHQITFGREDYYESVPRLFEC